MITSRWRAAMALVATTALVVTACTADTASDPSPTDERPTLEREGAPTLPDEVAVLGGTEEVTITGLRPRSEVHLADEDDRVLITGVADDLGQLHIGYVASDYVVQDKAVDPALPSAEGMTLPPGTYRVAVGSLDDDPAVSDDVEVLGKNHVPDAELYERQELTGVETPIIGDYPEGVSGADGFGYLEMRDGTLLSATVKFPDSNVYGQPPYPTIIEMEGYSASNPDGDPPGALLARSLGFATVAVNIRGTGCSGGVFDIFNAAQQVDAYDVVETVARQPWVEHGKVGVVGLSYSGMMAMYTGAMAPPSLAAIVPQSFTEDPWLVQWPGGVYNGGFAEQWVRQREASSAPGGSSWVDNRIDGGDATCADNLRLRSQNMDFVSFIRMLEARPDSADDRDLRELAPRIEVPTFLTGAFQDEQTGAYFTEVISRFDEAPILRVGLWSGVHADGYTAMNIIAWYEFLSLYVARQVPNLNPLVRVGLAAELASQFGVEDVTLAPDRLYDEFGDDYEAALAAYEAEDPIRVVFENGFGQDEPGEPGGTFELTLPTWPAPDADVRTWFLASDGALVDNPPADDGVDAYEHDPDAGDTTSIAVAEDGGYPQFDAIWDWDWTRFEEGRSLEYLTEPFAEDALLAGPGAVTLHMGSDAEDAAVQVSLSEVRPDGIEVLLTIGWLRLSARAEDPSATDGLFIGRTFAADDAEPIPAGELVEARVQIPSVGAPIRAGSQLMIRISTPGRDHALWKFASLHADDEVPTHRIGRGPATPSSLSLTFLPAPAIPSALAPCPALRGQACRERTAVTNRPGA
ncbi:MAG: CocE/NonD family hydrolase [Acidimicrobiia bacterium]|nr:CocE/NonD family hydrolase [Acidimicrobiia bacterium]